MNVIRLERRVEPRRRALLRASVVFGGGWRSMDCQVRDLSSRGARLRFAAPVLLPPMFELRLLERGDRKAAQKVWVREGEMGVIFD